MSLETYNKKRNFKETTEPKGVSKKSSNKLIFVVHNHFSKNHHYDLRLEMNGALASWAVPKEPPTEKGTKRLAVQVEDHPLSYATFKGTIPEGNYGAGKVEIWDNGTYELKFQDEKKIEFELNGKKLNGDYVLIKTSYGSKPEKSWLWFKV
jgi:DNA ligase D-like protein (predicted 3'-phosphoesterase)